MITSLLVRPLMLALLISATFATCPHPGCGKPSWNPSRPGDACRKSHIPTCLGCPAKAGDRAAGGYYTYCSPACHALANPAPCRTPGCGKPSWNGLPGQKCSRSCGAVAAPAATCTYVDVDGTGAHHGNGIKNGWRVRTYTFNGIMLQDAMSFGNGTPAAQLWKNTFFGSLQNYRWPGKMFYLKWNINKADLNNTSFSWKIVMTPNNYTAKYASTPVPHADPARFGHGGVGGSRIHSGNSPAMHLGGSNIDLVQVSPGTGGWTSGNDRCMFVGPFMQFSSEVEKTTLWQMCTDVAMQRLYGMLDRSCVMQYNGAAGSAYGNGVAALDQHGHNHIEINTHGGGVPWLHVRIETNPQYDPEKGLI